jgi:hypothetical protein
MVTFNEADVRHAVIQTEGNLTWAAARFAARRTDLKQYVDATPSLQAVIRDLQKDVDDEAESGLRDAVSAGDKSAVCFCLKTLGRSSSSNTLARVAATANTRARQNRHTKCRRG